MQSPRKLNPACTRRVYCGDLGPQGILLCGHIHKPIRHKSAVVTLPKTRKDSLDHTGNPHSVAGGFLDSPSPARRRAHVIVVGGDLQEHMAELFDALFEGEIGARYFQRRDVIVLDTELDCPSLNSSNLFGYNERFWFSAFSRTSKAASAPVYAIV